MAEPPVHERQRQRADERAPLRWQIVHSHKSVVVTLQANPAACSELCRAAAGCWCFLIPAPSPHRNSWAQGQATNNTLVDLHTFNASLHVRNCHVDTPNASHSRDRCRCTWGGPASRLNTCATSGLQAAAASAPNHAAERMPGRAAPASLPAVQPGAPWCCFPQLHPLQGTLRRASSSAALMAAAAALYWWKRNRRRR